MVAGGLTEKVTSDRSVSFCFYSCGEIPPPVIMVQVIFYLFKQVVKSDYILFCYQCSYFASGNSRANFQNVSFRYNEHTPWIYKNLEFGMDLDTR